MNNAAWILLDTETTGLSAPVYVVELAAQRMHGWEPVGDPFRRLLNQNAEIPSEASRVHGYTREILERDGEPPTTVYREFEQYVSGVPLVAYNLDYDLESVLKPEWQRLGIRPIGTEGFCALRLAQRLLDPVPAGNCKLQTLRQFYRLPERGAHTAVGDVQTVIDLFGKVLRPIAERRGLGTWADISDFTKAEWFPSRISFGKFKGRDFQEAKTDPDLHAWLEWLCDSSNARTASMGRWYLAQLALGDADGPDIAVIAERAAEQRSPEEGPGIIVFVHPELTQLRALVSAARNRLAEIEADYTRDRCAVEATQAKLFNLLRSEYQRRDRLRLIVDYRRQYLKVLLDSGEDEAAEIAEEYQKARTQSDADYEGAAKAAEDRKELSEDEQNEIKSLWKKLVRIYHPDRFIGDQRLKETYERLTATINKAKEEADIEILREIANDTNGFILRQGWKQLDLSDEKELAKLRKLYENLQAQILDMLEALNRLRESGDYELFRLSARSPDFLHKVAAEQKKAVALEVERLAAEAEKLRSEIADLIGQEADSVTE